MNKNLLIKLLFGACIVGAVAFMLLPSNSAQSDTALSGETKKILVDTEKAIKEGRYTYRERLAWSGNVIATEQLTVLANVSLEGVEQEVVLEYLIARIPFTVANTLEHEAIEFYLRSAKVEEHLLDRLSYATCLVSNTCDYIKLISDYPDSPYTSNWGIKLAIGKIMSIQDQLAALDSTMLTKELVVSSFNTYENLTFVPPSVAQALIVIPFEENKDTNTKALTKYLDNLAGYHPALASIIEQFKEELSS